MITRRISEYAEHTIDKPIPDNRGKRFYLNRPAHLKDKTVGGKYHVVMVAYYADPHLLKKALVLRRSGKVFITLIAGCIREDVRIEDYVDQAYEYDHFRDFYDLCQGASPHSWHAVTPYYHSAIILYAGCDGSRLITDVVDAALFFYKDKEKTMMDLESDIMACSHGVVHKIPEQAWPIVETSYGIHPEHLSFLSYPDHRFAHRNGASGEPLQEVPRLVYAGGIIPYDIALSRGHENHIFDDLIDMTGPDSFDLTIYVNQNARDMPWHQHRHYYELEEKYPFFHFRKGVPYHSVAKELSRYTAGIFYDNIKKSSYNPDHFRFNIASKLFTYLEAGIPVIVYDESEYMANLVKGAGIGEVYSIQDEKTLVHAASRIAKGSFREAIDRFCKTNTCDAYREGLLTLHGI